MVVDKAGYRLNVGIVLINQDGQVFWGRRCGQDSWQFPQGGIRQQESLKAAMYRELEEEVGLVAQDVEFLGVTKRWLKYRLPKKYIRRGTSPVVIGQRQKWFLLRLNCPEEKIRLDLSTTPEFDSWRWLDYKEAAEQVIFFKRKIYQLVLDDLAHNI